jgi:hypothetical protein
MPAENPPSIFRTPDKEWIYLRTLVDYDQMQKFRHKCQCICTNLAGKEGYRRVRLPCKHRWAHNCQFKLLALKTTNQGYHVYKYGEHNNHPTIKPKGKCEN